MKSFEYLCLYCLQAFRGERTTSAIYHLLKGKRSSQTIQDANLFSLAFLFGVFPALSRAAIEKTIFYLKEQHFIKENRDGFYVLTEKGKEAFRDSSQIYSFSPFLNGWVYKNRSVVFWKRYSLLVQTLSNLSKERKDFIPVIYDESIQRFVKQFLFSQRNAKGKVAREIHKETYLLLQKTSHNQAFIFVAQLSGHRHAGLTIHQVAKRVGLDIPWTRLEFQSVLHFILQEIESNPNVYPYISRLCQDFNKRSHLTETTQKSFRLLEKGLSLSDIAGIRKLKMSTIEDHIVELALHVKGFSISPYVSHENVELIQEAVRHLQSNQLRRIKEYIGNNKISYFQIRLVLTKMGDIHESRPTIDS